MHVRSLEEWSIRGCKCHINLAPFSDGDGDSDIELGMAGPGRSTAISFMEAFGEEFD